MSGSSLISENLFDPLLLTHFLMFAPYLIEFDTPECKHFCSFDRNMALIN